MTEYGLYTHNVRSVDLRICPVLKEFKGRMETVMLGTHETHSRSGMILPASIRGGGGK